MSKTILFLADQSDALASTFVPYAFARGATCRLVSEWEQVEMSVATARDGTSQVRLFLLPENVPVTAVINRGMAPMPTEADERFRSGEILAAWWTVLALFPGPVINRPSLNGFLPTPQSAALARAVPELCLPVQRISNAVESFDSDSSINVHQFSDRRYLGRLSDCKGSLMADQTYVYTQFDPNTVWRLLLVGNHVFDLSTPTGLVRQDRRDLTRSIAAELQRLNATFCLVILCERNGRTELLQVTGFPGAFQYEHIGEAVNEALLGALAT